MANTKVKKTFRSLSLEEKILNTKIRHYVVIKLGRGYKHHLFLKFPKLNKNAVQSYMNGVYHQEVSEAFTDLLKDFNFDINNA